MVLLVILLNFLGALVAGLAMIGPACFAFVIEDRENRRFLEWYRSDSHLTYDDWKGKR